MALKVVTSNPEAGFSGDLPLFFSYLGLPHSDSFISIQWQ